MNGNKLWESSYHDYISAGRPLYATYNHQYVTGTIWPTIAMTMYEIGVIASVGIDW